MMQKLLKPNEVATFLSISRSQAYKLIQQGVIPSVRIGEKLIRVRMEDLEKFITDNVIEIVPFHQKSQISRSHGESGIS